MYNELTPEQEKELIDKTAQLLVKNNLSYPALFFIDSFKSLAWLGSRYASMFIEPFVPFKEKELSELLYAFEKIENVDMLLNKIEELTEEKQKEYAKERQKTKSVSWLDKIRKKINVNKKNETKN